MKTVKLKLSPETIRDIAAELASRLFKCGSEPGMECTRIEFKSETLGHEEKGMGGFIEDALRAYFIVELGRIINED